MQTSKPSESGSHRLRKCVCKPKYKHIDHCCIFSSFSFKVSFVAALRTAFAIAKVIQPSSYWLYRTAKAKGTLNTVDRFILESIKIYSRKWTRGSIKVEGKDVILGWCPGRKHFQRWEEMVVEAALLHSVVISQRDGVMTQEKVI